MALTFLLLASRGVAFWILASAAVQKMGAYQHFAALLSSRMRWSRRAGRAAASLTIVLELGLAGGLLWPKAWPYAAILAAVMLLGFTAVLAQWWHQGHVGECGCGGLLPVQQLTTAHVVLVGLLAGSAGTVGAVGLAGIGATEPTSSLLVAKLLVLVLPLPVLLLISAGMELKKNGHRLTQPGVITPHT